jgi:hypothetical protein
LTRNLLETYPGEAYPVDNCFVIGSIALHQRVTAYLCGGPHRRSGHWEYVSGGPLGNAILFAMMTAPPANIGMKREGA